MDRLSDVIQWLQKIQDTFGDLPVLKEEKEGIYTDITVIISNHNIRFKYKNQSPDCCSERGETLIGPIVEVF